MILNSKVKGIIAILISAVGFSFMSVFFRLAGDLPVFQKSLARNFVAMFIGVLLNIYAIDHMVLSDADTLMKLNPFWTIVLSLIFLHEKVRKYQITAMIIAIIGMLLIVKPEFSSSVIPSIAGLLSGIFAASAYTCVRALSTREKPYKFFSYSALDYQQL